MPPERATLKREHIRQLEPQEEVQIYVNQGWRDATVLACIGPEALLEYVMPSGRSALRKMPRNITVRSKWDDQLPETEYKSMSYYRIPKFWLVAIIRQSGADVTWWASPQQSPDLHMQPWDLFMSQWPRDAWLLDEKKPVREVTRVGPSPEQMQQTAQASSRVRARL